MNKFINLTIIYTKVLDYWKLILFKILLSVTYTWIYRLDSPFIFSLIVIQFIVSPPLTAHRNLVRFWVYTRGRFVSFFASTLYGPLDYPSLYYTLIHMTYKMSAVPIQDDFCKKVTAHPKKKIMASPNPCALRGY